MLRAITWVGSCVRGSLHGWGHVWGRPSDNGATHSGKGSICSKLFVRQGFCGWSGRVKFRLSWPKGPKIEKYCLASFRLQTEIFEILCTWGFNGLS